MALERRPSIGIQDFVYAQYDPALDTYGTIRSIPGLRKLGFNKNSSMTTFFADNGPLITGETIGEMAISLELADLLPQDIAYMLGHTYVNGILQEGSNDASPELAVGAKILKNGSDGGLPVYQYFWLPRVKFSKPSVEDMTKESSLAYKTPVLEGRVMITADGTYKTSIRTDDTTVPAGTKTNWFTAVVESTGASLTAVTVGTIVGGAAAHTITVPFAKSGETFSLRPIDSSDITVSVVSTGVLLAGTSTFTYSAAGVAPTITITNANISGVPYLVSVTSDVTDSNNVRVTPKSQLVTPV